VRISVFGVVTWVASAQPTSRNWVTTFWHLRESPVVELVETMIGNGYTVKIYDQNVSLAKLMERIKHIYKKKFPASPNCCVPQPKSSWIKATSWCSPAGTKHPSSCSAPRTATRASSTW
jgi:hypothetical protein